MERKSRNSQIRIEAFPSIDGSLIFIYKENGKEMSFNVIAQEILNEGLGIMLPYFGINAETIIRRAIPIHPQKPDFHTKRFPWVLWVD